MSSGGDAAAVAAKQEYCTRNDADGWIATLKECKIISVGSVKALCKQAQAILQEEANVHHVAVPATVVRARWQWG